MLSAAGCGNCDPTQHREKVTPRSSGACCSARWRATIIGSPRRSASGSTNAGARHGFSLTALVRQAALRRAQVLRRIATLPSGRPAPQSDMVRYQVTRAPGSLCGQTRGAVVKIFLLGATGNSGRRILRLAFQRAHEVTAFVRDETKLLSVVDRPIAPNLHVSIGGISK